MNSEWNKSTYSNSDGGACVEARVDDNKAFMRDTENRGLGHLAFGHEEWSSLALLVRGSKV